MVTLVNRDLSAPLHYLVKTVGEAPSLAEVLAGTSVAAGATATISPGGRSWVWIASPADCEMSIASTAAPVPRVWDSEAYTVTVDTVGEAYAPAGVFPAQTGLKILVIGSGTLWIGINPENGLADLTAFWQTHQLVGPAWVEISCRAADSVWLKAASGTVDLAIQRYSDQGALP